MPKRSTEILPLQEACLTATALFLMTEYMEKRSPMLAAMIAGELLALERHARDDSPIAAVVACLRHRWWLMARCGENA